MVNSVSVESTDCIVAVEELVIVHPLPPPLDPLPVPDLEQLAGAGDGLLSGHVLSARNGSLTTEDCLLCKIFSLHHLVHGNMVGKVTKCYIHVILYQVKGAPSKFHIW